MWVRLDDSFSEHPKVVRLGELQPMAISLFVVALCWANRQLTDGRLPKALVASLWPHRYWVGKSKRPIGVADLANALVAVGLWRDAGEDYEINGYLTYQPSRDEVLAKRKTVSEVRRRAGKKGLEFDDFLTPSRVERVLEMAMEQLRPQAASIEAEIGGLRDDLERLEGEVARLAGAVATGGDIPALITALKDRSQQQDDYRTRLTKLLRASTKGLSDEAVRATLHAKLEDWRGLLQRHVPQARQILKKLLRGSLLFHPRERGVDATTSSRPKERLSRS